MDIIRDSEARSKMCGVEAQMTKFEFLFGISLGVCIRRHTDNLSKTLQTPKLSASDDYFQLFWKKLSTIKMT